VASDEIELSSEQSEAEQQASSKSKIILIAVVGVALLAASVAGTLFLTSDFSDEAKTAPETAENEKVAADAIYLPLDPAFTVSLDGDESRRYLKVTMSVMSRSNDAIDAVRRHRPAIRNNLNFLLAGQTQEDLATRDGKEKLRQAAKEEIQNTLEANGEDSNIEALYFTDLVID